MSKIEEIESEKWRRSCGCIRTSEKLKQILKVFPEPPPPSPTPFGGGLVLQKPIQFGETDYMRAEELRNTDFSCHKVPTAVFVGDLSQLKMRQSLTTTDDDIDKKEASRLWLLIVELVSLIQLSVTATALALYYLIYCYMQLIYYTLRSAVYFHEADGSMKITIGIVTITSLVIGFYCLVQLEKVLGFTS